VTCLSSRVEAQGLTAVMGGVDTPCRRRQEGALMCDELSRRSCRDRPGEEAAPVIGEPVQS
jgi:hypothetical protein